MNESVDQAVVRVIESMYERVGEELTTDDMARTAVYSKFHFSRVFSQVTGVSPGRFLAAVRFQEAKRLLVATSLSVAEISNRVGYSSLGTFSTRFKHSVGVTPTQYRRMGGRWQPADCAPAGPIVRGRVWAEADCYGATFVGLFPDPVPHRLPVRYRVLSSPGPYALTGVPEGTWYLVAHAVRLGPDRASADLNGSVGHCGPVTVRGGEPDYQADVKLRPMRPVDLPMLSAPFVARPQELR